MVVKYFCDICKDELTTSEKYYISMVVEDENGHQNVSDVLMADHDCYWKIKGAIAGLDPAYQSKATAASMDWRDQFGRN